VVRAVGPTEWSRAVGRAKPLPFCLMRPSLPENRTEDNGRGWRRLRRVVASRFSQAQHLRSRMKMGMSGEDAKQACIMASNRAVAAMRSLAASDSVKTLCDSDANFRRFQALFFSFVSLAFLSDIWHNAASVWGPFKSRLFCSCLAPPRLDQGPGG
jgi:hypothetical protein